VVSKAQLVHQEKLARGVVPELMVPVVCQESQVPRVTGASMDFLGFLERRATGERLGLLDLPELLGRTARGERMARSDQGGWLARPAQEVFLDQEDHPDLLDSPVLLELMAHKVLKETWDLKESQGLPDSRAFPGPRVFQDLRAPLDLPVKKDPKVVLACLACLAPTDPQVTLARRVLLERRELWVSPVLKVLLAILVLVVLREQMACVD